MNSILKLLISLVLLGILSACVTVPQNSMRIAYPKMYDSNTVSILILPPVNNSTAADAKEYFACSLSEAVGQTGYYTLPVETVYTVLREEGMYDTETYTPAVLSNLKKYFGADAVLYSRINKWDKAWFLTSGSLTIDANFELIATETAEIIWDYHTITKVHLGSSSDNLFVAMLESAAKTATEDYFPNAKAANKNTFQQTIPYGKYHPNHKIDGERTVSKTKTGLFEISK